MSKIQTALLGGLFSGTLSALPFVDAGNLCCCLWIVSGGAVAAYLLQQNQPGPIAPGDGALVGLMAGVTSALVYLVLSIPIALILAPYQREVLERLTPIFDEWPVSPLTYMSGPLGVFMRFMAQLFEGVVFSTIGGLVGAAVVRRTPPPEPPGAIDI